MTERLNIHAITPQTPNWICKVQVVDMDRPGEGIKQKIKYMNMIFQDEQMFHTYLITGARVQQPTLRYEIPLHTFDWIIDKKTIVDSIDNNDSNEIELPLPRIVNVTSFQDINNQASRASKE
ncbi:hypothetical protein P3L10_002344 [Capsicum annuum]